jgi:hypothetical protein
MRRLGIALGALFLAGCSSTAACVTPCDVCAEPRDQAAVIEVVQDPGCCRWEALGHIRAGGNVRAFEAMERVKVEARKLGADAITNVHRVTGTDEAIYEADAVRWMR